MTLPIIDSHQHVWSLDRSPYSWLAQAPPELRKDMTLEAALPEMTAAGVRHTILVQADDTDADTALMLEYANRFDIVVGVVGYLPLDDPGRSAETLDRYARDRRIVGVRSLTHDRDDDDFLLREDVDESLELLARAGLPLDLVATRQRHLELVPIISERHPTLRMVLDHLAKPPFGADLVDSPWWRGIADAARNPLLCAKISGLYLESMTHAGATKTAAAIRPAVDRALDVFGSDRLMVGSDWPVSLPFGGYPHTAGFLDSILSALSMAERDDLAARTAIRHYGLDLSDRDHPRAAGKTAS